MANKYYYAKGRRKESVATVRLYEGEDNSQLNGEDIKELNLTSAQKSDLLQPLKVVDRKKDMYFTAKVKGGGVSGWIGAVSLALSRALVKYDETLKSDLKLYNLLTRDPRMKERKKTGLKKARRAPQFSKR